MTGKFFGCVGGWFQTVRLDIHIGQSKGRIGNIYISTSARLRFSIHGEKVIFFGMAEVENASAGLAD